LKKKIFCSFCVDNTSCVISPNSNDIRNAQILACCLVFFTALIWIWYYDSEITPQLSLGILMIFNVWLLARWSNSFHFGYSVDIVTVYLLVWQLSYLIFQWSSHKLSWPFLILYQSSICILLAIKAFLFYDLFFRYLPSIHIVLIWFTAVEDM
jgi:hypothetical protein